MPTGPGKHGRSHIIGHDTPPARQELQIPNGRWLGDVEQSKQHEPGQHPPPFPSQPRQRHRHDSYFVQHNPGRVFLLPDSFRLPANPHSGTDDPNRKHPVGGRPELLQPEPVRHAHQRSKGAGRDGKLAGSEAGGEYLYDGLTHRAKTGRDFARNRSRPKTPSTSPCPASSKTQHWRTAHRIPRRTFPQSSSLHAWPDRPERR